MKQRSIEVRVGALILLAVGLVLGFVVVMGGPMGVYEAARLHGLHIPDDLSVVGFDDIPMAAWMAPALTTMRQPLSDMAALGVRLLLGVETQHLGHRIELATNLVVRESTAPPASMTVPAKKGRHAS